VHRAFRVNRIREAHPIPAGPTPRIDARAAGVRQTPRIYAERCLTTSKRLTRKAVLLIASAGASRAGMPTSGERRRAHGAGAAENRGGRRREAPRRPTGSGARGGSRAGVGSQRGAAARAPDGPPASIDTHRHGLLYGSPVALFRWSDRVPRRSPRRGHRRTPASAAVFHLWTCAPWRSSQLGITRAVSRGRRLR